MDCLVTKLKASVNDESLRRLGEFRFKKREGMQETTDSTYFGIEVINSAILSILNDGCFFQAGTITPDTSAGKHKTLNSGMNYLWASLNAELSLVST